ncbi:MAG: 2-hydroxyacyl-CoA dehydratase family protein [Dehalococcoidales bacterium]|nr:2-hydroxyacyl-CoA dehydratase family protein [Dehalococcoidales bacterium]
MATEAEVKKSRPINRLQTVYALRAYQDEIYSSAREASLEGKPTAWCMREMFGSMIMNAMGVESVYPENYGTVCASAKAIVPYLERSEAEGFPNYVCSYMQNTFGYSTRMYHELGGEIPPEAPRGGMANPTFILCSGRGCEARYKAFQALGRYFNAPVWVTELPGNGEREQLMPGAYERDVKFLVKGMREFVNWLERLLGKKMDWDVFEQRLAETIEMQRVQWDMNELRVAEPSPMNARDWFSAMSAATFSARDVPRLIGLYQDMKDEVQHRVDNKISGINREEKYRLTFNGLGPWHSMNIFDELAERGWNFPREGYHYNPPLIPPTVTDPLEREVRFYWPSLSDVIDYDFSPEEAASIKKEIMKKGHSPRLQSQEARHFKSDGVLLWRSYTCRPASGNQQLYMAQLLETAKIPSMVYETDMCDPRLFDMADFLKKAEAFEETMEHYREVRKKEGMDW